MKHSGVPSGARQQLLNKFKVRRKLSSFDEAFEALRQEYSVSSAHHEASEASLRDISETLENVTLFDVI